MQNPIAAAICKGIANIIEAFDKEARLGGDGAHPDEEQLTTLLWQATFPPLVRVKFNRSQESHWGADWLWWFVSATGRCFGLLAQAKVLRGTPGARHIKFEQSNQQGRQDQALMRTADDLDIPAAYIIYFGPPRYRPDLTGSEREEAVSDANEEMTVGMLDLLVYKHRLAAFTDTAAAKAWGRQLRTPDAQRAPLQAGHNWIAETAFSCSRPLIHLADGASEHLWPRLAFMYPTYQGVWEDLAAETSGPAQVAAAIVDHLTTIRLGQFSHITTLAPTEATPVFTDLPPDRGHFTRPYLPYILRGYRNYPPDYVQEVLDNHEISTSLPPTVQGVAVVTDY